MLHSRGWEVLFLNRLGDSAMLAIGVIESLLVDQENVLGRDHPDILGSRSNLANAYRAAGRTAEAITLRERTLTDRERILGADHPDTLKSRNNLAAAQRAQSED